MFHKDPLPTIAVPFLCQIEANCIDEESDEFSLFNLIFEAYEHLDRLTGIAFLERLQPDDMTRDEFVLFRFRTLCLNRP